MKRKNRTLAEVIGSGGLMDVPEVAAALRVSQPTIYAWAKSGKLPCIRLGELALRFRPEDVVAFIDGQAQGGV